MGEYDLLNMYDPDLINKVNLKLIYRPSPVMLVLKVDLWAIWRSFNSATARILTHNILYKESKKMSSLVIGNCYICIGTFIFYKQGILNKAFIRRHRFTFIIFLSIKFQRSGNKTIPFFYSIRKYHFKKISFNIVPLYQQ